MYTELIPFVSQVGFPIVAFLLMYHLVTTTVKDNTAALRELTDMIKRYRGDKS